MRRCPIPMSGVVDMQLSAVVRDGPKVKPVTNLGWLLRNWQLVESFDCYPHPPTESRSMPPDLYLVARLSDGRTYETGYGSLSVFGGFVDRPVFRGLPINLHPKVAGLIKRSATHVIGCDRGLWLKVLKVGEDWVTADGTKFPVKSDPPLRRIVKPRQRG